MFACKYKLIKLLILLFIFTLPTQTIATSKNASVYIYKTFLKKAHIYVYIYKIFLKRHIYIYIK